jgi:hypothetical protein
VNNVLRDVSTSVLGWGDVEAAVEEAFEPGVEATSPLSVPQVRERAYTLLAEKRGGKTTKKKRAGDTREIRIATLLDHRKVMLLYENNVMKHEEYIKYLARLYDCSEKLFKTEDPRILMMEGGAKGPGHHGSMTLSDEKTSEQQQVRDPTSSSKRSRK